MSKEFKNIDELYKAELGHVSAKAPAHVKAGIDSALGFKKKRGGLWWFILPVLAAAIIIPLAMANWNDVETQLSQEDQTILDATDDNATDISNETEDANQSSSSSNTNNSLNNSASDTESGNGSNLLSDNGATTYNSNSGSNNGSTNVGGTMSSGTNNGGGISGSSNSGTQSGGTNSGGVNSNTGSGTTDGGENGNGNTNSGSTIGGTVTEAGDSEGMGTVSDAGDNGGTKTPDEDRSGDQAGTQEGGEKNGGDGSEEGTGDGQSSDEGTSNGNTTAIDNDTKTTGDTTDLADNEAIDTTETSGPDTEVPPIPEEDLTPPPPKHRPWMISAHLGGNFTSSNLLSTDDTTDAFYENSVNDKASVGFGLSVDYRLKNGISFGSGIRYTSFKENFSYQKSQTVVVDSTSMWTVFVYDSIVDSMMNVTYLYDSTYSSTPVYGQLELFNQSGTNSRTYLHIPIRIGYQLGVGDKWKFDFMVQGRFNLLLRSTTSYVLNDQIITENNGAFTNSYLDLELGTSAHYNLWKNLYVTGVVRYRPPMNRTYYAPTIENRFQSFYLGVGVSINL